MKFLMYRVELKVQKWHATHLNHLLRFLMYRVELKGSFDVLIPLAWLMFLMYRVELKAFSDDVPCHPLGKFLMYRVELKELPAPSSKHRWVPEFLMYRVELKAGLGGVVQGTAHASVPNVPCGVESWAHGHKGRNFSPCPVPNVPCGVERSCIQAFLWSHKQVPNVPCGVESLFKRVFGLSILFNCS